MSQRLPHTRNYKLSPKAHNSGQRSIRGRRSRRDGRKRHLYMPNPVDLSRHSLPNLLDVGSKSKRSCCSPFRLASSCKQRVGGARWKPRAQRDGPEPKGTLRSEHRNPPAARRHQLTAGKPTHQIPSQASRCCRRLSAFIASSGACFAWLRARSRSIRFVRSPAILVIDIAGTCPSPRLRVFCQARHTVIACPGTSPGINTGIVTNTGLDILRISEHASFDHRLKLVQQHFELSLCEFAHALHQTSEDGSHLSQRSGGMARKGKACKLYRHMHPSSSPHAHL